MTIAPTAARMTAAPDLCFFARHSKKKHLFHDMLHMESIKRPILPGRQCRSHRSQPDGCACPVVCTPSQQKRSTSLKGALSLNLYATLGAPKEKIKQLIDEVNKIDESRFHEEDLIGRVYEYFLQVYAASGTKEDGEFYTPACVVQLIAEMIEPYSGVVYEIIMQTMIQGIGKIKKCAFAV